MGLQLVQDLMEPKPIVELHTLPDLPFISAGHNSGLVQFQFAFINCEVCLQN